MTNTATAATARLDAACGHLVTSEASDGICVAPRSHAGPCEYVDAMGIVGLDENDRPLYRSPFNYAR
jgi:hypothetical protein